MKIRTPFLFFIFLLLSGSVWKGNHEDAAETMAAAFENPPSSARPGVFWCWLNGNMSREAITRDLEAMHSKGIMRAEIWDVAAVRNPEFIPAGGAFLGDESVSLIKHAISEGKRLGMKIGIIASSGWNAGGSWVTPDWASKALYFSEVQATGPVRISMELPFPKLPPHCPLKEDGTPVFCLDVAVLAVPYNDEKTINSPKQIIDLTAHVTDGHLDWEAPAGKWSIIRYVCSNTGQSLIVPSPKSNGLFIDFLDPEATKRHLQYFMDRLGVTPENASDSGLAYFEFDSMELEKGTPWTNSMPAIFKERQGYSIENYLPVLAGWNMKEHGDRFLYDFRKTVSDQLIFSHYTTGTEFLKKYKAELVAEAGGPGPPVWNTCPVDALKALGNVSVPRGEFWIRHRNMFLIKEVAGAAHIYGRKMVDAESFTTWRRWKDSPYEMKKHVDRAYCEGLNNVTFHTFAGTNPEDGLPGRTYHAGYDMNPGTTWWKKSKPFMDYLSRCNFLLQQGLFVADVCCYYGDQAPNFFPVYHSVPEKPRMKGLGEGYDYDVVNTDVILNRMSVKKGRITLPDGMSYAVLVLPEQEQMPLAVLQKIEELVKAGAAVIGPKPTSSPGLRYSDADKKLFGELSGKLWGKIDGKNITENAYGKGKVINGRSAEEFLSLREITKDFSFSSALAPDYIHRTTEGGEVYFIRNEAEERVKGEARFRVSGKYPECWDPATGVQTRVVNYREKNGQTAFQLDLPPHGSMFVVFNNRQRSLPVHESREQLTEQELKGPWRISFPEGWGAPSNVVFDRLQSWTGFEEPGIKYFSGTATYQKSFTIGNENKEKRCFIELGEVRDVAEVFINGKSAGILWKKPFRADITEVVKDGENELKIEVVNMWINRLTGDMQLDPKDRYCRTNQPFITREVWPGGDETFRNQTSGLLGPVKLLFGSKKLPHL
ncbi:MAG: glycosyl hydrolase [Mangrovibacterium sp.]